MHQHHGHGLAASIDHGVDRAVHGSDIKVADHRSLEIDPFMHLKNMAPCDQRCRFVDIEVVGFMAFLAPDDQDIPEPLGGDEAGCRSLALQDRIGGHCRCMQDAADVAGRDPGRRQQRVEARQRRHGQIMWCARDLQKVRRASPVVMQDEIGECTADIEGNADHRGSPASVTGSP